jgi:DNA-binding NarL/FixJ family response regulator
LTTRVLIADDQALVRDGFRMILEAEDGFEVVGEAADGLEAVLAARETMPDVILMDVRMPNVDGLEATRKLLERDDTGARVLILTTFDLDEYVYEALRAGASGFLLKDTPPEQLVDAIRIVAQGDELLAPTVTCRVVAEFARALGASSGASGDVEELAPNELALLRRVASGLSNAEIAAETHTHESTVRADVARILATLRLRDRVHAVVFAHERGILTVDECADTDMTS